MKLSLSTEESVEPTSQIECKKNGNNNIRITLSDLIEMKKLKRITKTPIKGSVVLIVIISINSLMSS